MPHSTNISSVAPSSPVEEDSVLPDAPLNAQDEVTEEVNNITISQKKSTKKEVKGDIKLEDLFNDDDDDDDEEFPSSGATMGMAGSSPPAAPL